MENTNITISLDTRRLKKDGTYPLIMRIGHCERTTAIPLGISLKEKDWDTKTKTVKKNYEGLHSVTRLNNLIQKKKADAMDILLKLHEAGKLQALSVTDLRAIIAKENSADSFFEYTQKLVGDLITSNRIGTARSYKGVISVLKSFNKGKDLSFAALNYSYLQKFETHHRNKGNEANGLAVYMRTIRAIYNKAIKEGIAEQDSYPFASYKIKTQPTEKRALDWDLLKKIIELPLEPAHSCYSTRNYFLASYMLYGMNFSDMAHLKKSDVYNGRITYRRRKTKKLYDIKITGSLQKILDYFAERTPESEYLFPILKRSSSVEQDKDIQWARKRYNKKLKILAKLCGIEQNLTSYVSRHSFATQAMMQHIPLNAISTMLGHSSLKTTEIYLKSLPSNVLDDFNAQILSGF